MGEVRGLLEVNEVSRSFSDQEILTQVTFKVDPYHSICITGDNGSGKSTLLRMIAGQILPSSGTVSVGSHLSINFGLFKKKVSFLESEKLPLFSRLSGEANLQFYESFETKRSEDEIDTYQRNFKRWSKNPVFKKALRTQGYQSSSGMKQMICLFRVLNRPCQLIILDEPWRFLSDSSLEFVKNEILENFSDKTFVIATHAEDKFKGFFFNTYKIENKGLYAL